ncbi:carbohydrate kinase family protein [Granulosicoccus antarcticus]|uniref:2-dehydro-3-deoxygluconokinase n=1 Tax=Granulosicoccus antarcticus IMCC3135 TaxID=1192854 RepID=A0A2Z2NZD3_9GAMM|nr:sugar kinase [Granulosicoccus antarcticus]ASJ76812.1 2-dehydro-3-deoxygluconokinase [Granulosicoccus antarcticus IMCC3135]
MNDTTIISVGELLVEFVSHRKGCALRELAEFTGPYASGAPAICIDQAARMGARTKIFGGLGADNFGNVLTDRLQASGVDTSAVLRLEDKTTGVAFVSYFDDGTRTFIFHLNDTAADAIAETPFVLPEGALLLHVSGASLGNANLRVAIESIASQVLARGGKISCDPNARAELMRDQAGRDMLFRMMEHSSYLFPSTSDLEFLFPGKSEEQSIDQMRSYGADILALKRGSQGALIISGEDRFEFCGHKVQEVDPTGAGDAFCGTFLAMITQGHSPESAGRYANAAGALAVTRRGPMEGNSDSESIEQLLKLKS